MPDPILLFENAQTRLDLTIQNPYPVVLHQGPITANVDFSTLGWAALKLSRKYRKIQISLDGLTHVSLEGFKNWSETLVRISDQIFPIYQNLKECIIEHIGK